MRFALKLTLFFGVFVMLLLLFGTQIHAWGRTIEVEEGLGVVDRVGRQKTRSGAAGGGRHGGAHYDDWRFDELRWNRPCLASSFDGSLYSLLWR